MVFVANRQEGEAMNAWVAGCERFSIFVSFDSVSHKDGMGWDGMGWDCMCVCCECMT